MSSRFPSTLACSLVILMLGLGLGCGEKQEIRSYRAPKVEGQQQAADAAPAVPRRMVVATLLAHDKAWFFKVEGPPDKIESEIDSLHAFFETIVVPADTEAKPQWELPEDWQQQPASGMRLATLQIPSAGLEVAISELGGVGDEQEYLLMNVNRWLGQVNQPSIEAAALDEQLETIEVEGGKLWLLDATGTSSSAAMMPPFAGRLEIPESGTPPQRGAQSPSATETEPITFELPEGWVEAPPRPMVARVLKLGSGDLEAEVAISAFPASAPSIADPLSNTNRWRSEVKLGEITAAELDESVEEVAIGDDTGKLVTALGDASDEEARGVIAAMVTKGDRVWFMKLHGSRQSVEHHRDSLVEWLKTVHIAEGN